MTRKAAAERMADTRARRAAGLVHLDVWVTPEVKDAMVEVMIEMQALEPKGEPR